MRKLILTVVALALASPVSAQEKGAEAANKAVRGEAFPANWLARLDRDNMSVDDVKFFTMGAGLHATTGPSAIFYDPGQTARGTYQAEATFTQTRAPQHPEAYGLIVGGANLGAADQAYLYFLVRQDGKFLIKRRAGAETHNVVEWTDNNAVIRADEAGKATNALRIDVGATNAQFFVNGVSVAVIARNAALPMDGIVGLRVNHNLDVHIANFAIAGGS